MKRAAFVSALGAAALVPRVRARAADAPIRFGTTVAETFSLPLIARELGYFTSAGVSVDISLFAGGAAVSQGVIGRAVDVGCTNTGTFCNTHPRGIPFTIIAPGALYLSSAPTTVLVVAKTAPFSTAKDLTGKTVAVATLRESMQAILMRWLDQTGGSSASIRYVELSAAQMDAALLAGRVDAGMMQEPFLAAAKSDIRKIAQPFDTLGPRFLNTAYFAHSEWLAQNEGSAKKLVAALKRAATWANNNDTAIIPILAKYTKMAPETLATVTRARHGEVLQPDTIQPVIDVMAQYKFAPDKFPASELVWIPKA